MTAILVLNMHNIPMAETEHCSTVKKCCVQLRTEKWSDNESFEYLNVYHFNVASICVCNPTHHFNTAPRIKWIISFKYCICKFCYQNWNSEVNNIQDLLRYLIECFSSSPSMKRKESTNVHTKMIFISIYRKHSYWCIIIIITKLTD